MARRIRDAQGPVDDIDCNSLAATNDISHGGSLTTSAGAGAVTTASTTVAEEHGDEVDHLTKLTLTAFSLGNGADNADLAIGAKFYTFPAGTIMIENAALVGAFTSLASVTTIADGEWGIGTLIGSTAVDTLAEVDATAENVITGQAISTYVADGTSEVAAAVLCGDGADGPLLIRTTGGLAHDVFLNVAATWPNVSAAAAMKFTGVITLKWRKIS